MKTSKNRLLNDVLADDDYVAFRRTLYSQGIAHLRRRRWDRRRHQLMALAACGLIAAGLLFLLGPRAAQRRGAALRGEVVHSVPLRSDQVVVATGPGVQVISARLTDLTSGNERLSYELVRTATAPVGLEFISDGQLFELFPGQPMALVPAGEGGKRLCFLDPKARMLFLEGGSALSL